MNGESAIQDNMELIRRIKAYVILVMVDDLNVPPIEEQKAEQAAAPKQDANQLVPAKGNETRAPMVDQVKESKSG